MNTECLRSLLGERANLITESERNRAYRCIQNLEEGAPALQIGELPSLCSKNDESAYIHGKMLTDTIADWIHKGFVAGPFQTPPLRNFRSNQLKVVEKKGKVRPILNVSHPRGQSFNDNIVEPRMEKVQMSSAQSFSYSLLRAGKFALMSKFDMQDAYKNVPSKVEDLRLQGFEWGGSFFVETKQMFGARTAVANFDVLGSTILSLTLADCKIPKYLVHRQLDDVPVVAPVSSGWCEEFSEKYTKMCNRLKIGLAPECPSREKAFVNSTTGTVLGVEFNTTNLTWRLPKDKREEYADMVHEILQKKALDITAAQSLLGRLNFITSMAPYMKTFKKNVQDLIGQIEESGQLEVPLPKEVSSDLSVWWNFLMDNEKWLPIEPEESAPPLSHKILTTDAAGWREGEGGWSEVGAGCIGLDEEGRIFFANQFLWSKDSVWGKSDKEGKSLGCKTTALEFTGILIPFLLIPEELSNQSIVVQVDNIGCHFAWLNGHAEDKIASVLVRCLRLIAIRINSVVSVVHVKRESTWESRVADRLSRKKTTMGWERRLLASFPKLLLPPAFEEWARNPWEDWDLPLVLVNQLFVRH